MHESIVVLGLGPCPAQNSCRPTLPAYIWGTLARQAVGGTIWVCNLYLRRVISSFEATSRRPIRAHSYSTRIFIRIGLGRGRDAFVGYKVSYPRHKRSLWADFVLGLVPGLGDALSMGFSGLLIVTMVRKGVSMNLALRMLLNVLLDTVVGTIPILGNVFDLFYKANRRNLLLMREHYDEGKHAGSAWPVVLVILAVLAVLVATILGVLYWLLSNLPKFFPVSP